MNIQRNFCNPVLYDYDCCRPFPITTATSCDGHYTWVNSNYGTSCKVDKGGYTYNLPPQLNEPKKLSKKERIKLNKQYQLEYEKELIEYNSNMILYEMNKENDDIFRQAIEVCEIKLKKINNEKAHSTKLYNRYMNIGGLFSLFDIALIIGLIIMYIQLGFFGFWDIFVPVILGGTSSLLFHQAYKHKKTIQQFDLIVEDIRAYRKTLYDNIQFTKEPWKPVLKEAK